MNGTRAQRTLAGKLLALLIALSFVLSSVAPVFAARDDGRTNRQCVPGTIAYQTGEESSNAEDSNETSSAQAAPSGDNEVFTPGTKAYEVAKNIFEHLTKNYGLSGACAAGILSNIKAESGFLEDKAEGAYSSSFGMNSKTPPGEAHAYVGSNIGGGLYQETPYTVYTESSYWQKDGLDGWHWKNQTDFMMQFANRMNARDPNFNCAVGTVGYALRSSFASSMDWYLTDDPTMSAITFCIYYLRPWAPAAQSTSDERFSLAVRFNEVFNKDNVKGNESKINIWLGAANGASGIDISSSSEDEKKSQGLTRYIYDDNCEIVKLGCLEEAAEPSDNGIIAVLWELAANNAQVGYDMGACHGMYGNSSTDIDCTGTVSYAILKANNWSEGDVLGGTRMATGGHGGDHTVTPWLESIGYTEVPFTSVEHLEAGDVLWYYGHAATFVGWYDAEGNLSQKGAVGAIPTTVEALGNEAGGLNGGAIGDTGRPSSPISGFNGQMGGEVGGVDARWWNAAAGVHVLRPPKSMVAKFTGNSGNLYNKPSSGSTKTGSALGYDVAWLAVQCASRAHPDERIIKPGANPWILINNPDQWPDYPSELENGRQLMLATIKKNHGNSAYASCCQAACMVYAAVVDMDACTDADDGPGETCEYMASSPYFERIYTNDINDCQPGDILCRSRSLSDGHVAIFVGNKLAQSKFPGTEGNVYEAGYNNASNGMHVAKYPGINKWTSLGDFMVYRPVKRNTSSRFADVDWKSLMDVPYTKNPYGYDGCTTPLEEDEDEFDGGQEYQSAEQWQKDIVAAARATGPTGSGYCAAWVSNVFAKVGINFGGNAREQWRDFCSKSSYSYNVTPIYENDDGVRIDGESKRGVLKVGMIVATPSSSSGSPAGTAYGHVGVYIGDNKIMHNTNGGVETWDFDRWIDAYTENHDAGWGFPSGLG